MLSGEEYKRERKLIEDIEATPGLERHTAIHVEMAILSNPHILLRLPKEEQDALRGIIEDHGFKDAEWAEPLFSEEKVSSKEGSSKQWGFGQFLRRGN